MKVSKETMALHREQIIASAAKRFREFGFDGISVSELMREVGLTHGGFYGHFSSKEELAALAAGRAIDEMAEKWSSWIQSAKGDPLKEFGDKYLSLLHLEHPERGCLMAACGSELARQPPSVKKVVTERLEHCFEAIGRAIPLASSDERKDTSITVLATLIGGMVLARSASSPQHRDSILRTVAASVPAQAQAFAKARKLHGLRS
jgi:TetR/AcrR family transcriptional repressor of nem operon